jgi:hypothetical protein
MSWDLIWYSIPGVALNDLLVSESLFFCSNNDWYCTLEQEAQNKTQQTQAKQQIKKRMI